MCGGGARVAWVGVGMRVGEVEGEIWRLWVCVWIDLRHWLRRFLGRQGGDGAVEP